MEAPQGIEGMNVAFYPKESLRCHVHWFVVVMGAAGVMAEVRVGQNPRRRVQVPVAASRRSSYTPGVMP